MSSSIKEKIICPQCNTSQDAQIYSSINVTVNPSLKEIFLNKKINWVKCVECGMEIFIPVEFVYHDMDKQFLVIFKHSNSNSTHTEKKFSEYAEQLKIAEYMSYPIIVTDPNELMISVMYCDSVEPPKSKESALQIVVEARKILMMTKGDVAVDPELVAKWKTALH